MSAVVLLALLLVSCGDEPAPTATTPAVPAWAKVAPEQIAEAKTCVHDGEELRVVL